MFRAIDGGEHLATIFSIIGTYKKNETGLIQALSKILVGIFFFDSLNQTTG